MRAVCISVLLLPCAFAQIESDTLTIRASRSVRLAPDQVIFQVIVSSSLNTGFEDVVAALSGLNITAADLTHLSGGSLQSQISWNINVTVPFSRMKTTASALALLRQTLPKNGKGMTLDFLVQGSQVSSQAMQAYTCVVQDLVTDARLEAAQVAHAAQLFVGPILAMSDGASNEAPAAPATFEILHIVDPITGQVLYPVVPTILTRTAPDPTTCAVDVKFRLLRYH